jgi:signal transduction histidine kinase
VEVSTATEDGSVIVVVKDYGRGIPAKDLPYIFNRFFRVEKTKSLEGLGLGLFLSRQIIEAHQGRTWVESVEGQGSAFYFSVPLTHPDAAPDGAAGAPSA